MLTGRSLGLSARPSGIRKGTSLESGPRSSACASFLEPVLLGGGPNPVLLPHPLSWRRGWGCPNPLKEGRNTVISPGAGLITCPEQKPKQPASNLRDNRVLRGMPARTAFRPPLSSSRSPASNGLWAHPQVSRQSAWQTVGTSWPISPM